MIRKFIRRLLGNGPNTGEAHAPLVFGPDEHGIDPDDVSSNAVRVTETLQRAGFKAFIVGGAVRDMVLGFKPKDFDVATNATPEQIKRLDEASVRPLAYPYWHQRRTSSDRNPPAV